MLVLRVTPKSACVCVLAYDEYFSLPSFLTDSHHLVDTFSNSEKPVIACTQRQFTLDGREGGGVGGGSTAGWERGGMFPSALIKTDLLKNRFPRFPWSNGLRSPNQLPTGVHTHVATIGWLEGNLCLWAPHHGEDLSRLWRVIWVCVCVQTLVLHQAFIYTPWVYYLPFNDMSIQTRCETAQSHLAWLYLASFPVLHCSYRRLQYD